MGLQAALEMRSKRVHIESDSEFMVKQLNTRELWACCGSSIAIALLTSDASRIESPNSATKESKLSVLS